MKPKSGFVQVGSATNKGKFGGNGRPTVPCDMRQSPKGYELIIMFNTIKVVLVGVPLAFIIYEKFPVFRGFHIGLRPQNIPLGVSPLTDFLKMSNR
jgi:hypothetical protein